MRGSRTSSGTSSSHGHQAPSAEDPSAEDPSAEDQEVRRRAILLIARIDDLVGEMVNQIIHHPRFQALEASWRGLAYLVDQVTPGSNVKIRVLNVTWKAIANDLDETEFDQSLLFRKIYEDAFGTPGGQPFGLMVGDFEIHKMPTPAHPVDDLAVLTKLAGIAAAAFCPTICAAHPSLFEVDTFSDLEAVRTLEAGFETTGLRQLPLWQRKWKSLRELEDARFIGLTLPRILMRRPHDDCRAVLPFRFREQLAARSSQSHLGLRHVRDNYLWGNAAYAFAEVVIRAFSNYGWLADIRGVQRDRDRDGGGLVVGLAADTFAVEPRGDISKCMTDLIITDQQEARFSRLGFIPLCHCQDTGFAAFYSCASVQRPKTYEKAVASRNARLAATLQYTLCVSRFAHYLKIKARDEIGSVTDADGFEALLQRWINRYITPDPTARAEVRARQPLRDADVKIQPDVGRPGSYVCTFHLQPHYQLEDLSGAIRLFTKVQPPTSA